MSSRPSDGPRRELILKPPVQRPSKPKPTAHKTLQRPSVESESKRKTTVLVGRDLHESLQSHVTAESFSLTTVPHTGSRRWGEETKRGEESPSDSTSVTVSEQAKKKTGLLRRRARRRAKRTVDHHFEEGGLTHLEQSAVAPATSKQYQTELQMFLDFARPRKLDISKEKNMDKLLTSTACIWMATRATEPTASLLQSFIVSRSLAGWAIRSSHTLGVPSVGTASLHRDAPGRPSRWLYGPPSQWRWFAGGLFGWLSSFWLR